MECCCRFEKLNLANKSNGILTQSDITPCFDIVYIPFEHPQNLVVVMKRALLETRSNMQILGENKFGISFGVILTLLLKREK